MGQVIAVTCNQPLRLSQLVKPWQNIRGTVEMVQQKKVEVLLQALIGRAEPFSDGWTNEEWQAEITALRELSSGSEERRNISWRFSPLIVPASLPFEHFALLEGVAVKETVQTDQKLSPLALIWLKETAAVFRGLDGLAIKRVEMGEGVVLLEAEDNETWPLQWEMTSHLTEHVDEGMLLLQVNLDDCTAEWIAYTSERLFAAGANDVTVIPLTMKKSRQGSMLQVLCYRSQLEAMKTILFQETTTFGVRYFPVAVHRLGRRFVTVQTSWGEVPVKIGYHRGQPVQVSPEYDVCARLARDAAVPLGVVYEEARRLAGGN
ncbi:MAG: nickel insertion protein [Clostridia bacterium]